MFSETAGDSPSCIVLLGCRPDSPRLFERLQTAVRLWSSGRYQVLVCTGWASVPGLPTEASYLQELAVAEGIPASGIIIEEQATNTLENALYSLPCLVALHVMHAAVVTSDYHMPRARLMFEAVYSETGIQLHFAEAKSSIPDAIRQELKEHEERGIIQMQRLMSRPDYSCMMLRDRKLTHPDTAIHTHTIAMQSA
ncbi:hypothetical protein WJX74_010035 [Apatococcus lobatus]|uniref:DUF218 domain-containing protein n=1 Tax=Apatococcus lobatus TaxID=904363 RepID=A0AAW1RK18_9CHLO